jgi:molecular chaperone DnaJ
MTTHYDTLDVSREASVEQIKRFYRRLVKLHHPDNYHSGSAEHTESDKRIRDINVAYSVFSKPSSRASYDAKLRKRVRYSEAEPEHCAKCGKPTGY